MAKKDRKTRWTEAHGYEQMNTWLPKAVKRRVKDYEARHGLSHAQFFVRALDALEETEK